MASASSAASASVPWTVMASTTTTTTTTAGANSLAVSVFAVEVGFGLVFCKVAPSFKSDGFFRPCGWRHKRRRSSTAAGVRVFAAVGVLGRGHFGALFFQDGFARELDSIAFHGQDFYQYLVAFLEFVFHAAHAMLRD